MQVLGPSGERWKLAHELIRCGEAEVICGSVSIMRDTSGPRASGAIQVSILSIHPVEIPKERQAAEVAEGRATVRQLLETDVRLQALFDEFGVSLAYFADYGNGRVLITDLPPD